jgi:glycine cleavage system H lipoate-binding protein
MTVILILLTFAVFIAIDWMLSRKKLPAVMPVHSPEPAVPSSNFIEGFNVPPDLAYHPGHAWARRERKNVVRVGMDEFAAALAGKVEKVELPKPGHWIRQGQKSWSLFRGQNKAEMLSPIEGEVVEINEQVVKDPSLVRRDPYGEGWLFAVFAPDEESVLRNLLPANLVGSWMGDTVHRLYAKQPAMAGAVMADGGRPAQDLSAAFPNTPWTELTAEFFLTPHAKI